MRMWYGMAAVVCGVAAGAMLAIGGAYLSQGNLWETGDHFAKALMAGSLSAIFWSWRGQ